MTEETSTQFRQEGEPAFPTDNKENDNSAASSAGEKTSDAQTGSSDQDQNQTGDKTGGEDKGFADHPRWKERESDWTKRFNEQETRHVSEITKLREEFEAKYGPKAATQEQQTTDMSTEKPPAWFGGDEDQWKEFTAWNNKLISQAEERGAEKAMKGIEAKSQAETKAIEDATNYFNKEVAAIESDKAINPQGTKVDRNKLLKTAMDNDLVDSKGNWNYRAAWRILNGGTAASAASTQDRKALAGATTSENRAEAKPANVTTSEDFQKAGGRPW